MRHAARKESRIWREVERRAAGQPGARESRQIAYHWQISSSREQKPVTALNQNATRGIQGTVSNALALVSGAMKSSSSPKEEPERLVERAQNGDREAFEQIYRQQVGRIHALCWRLTGDADLAEELTQEAFVRAWRKLHLFSGRSALSTWLHRLTANVVMADHRVHGTRRRRQLPLDDVHSERLVAKREATDVGLDLERAIATLPSRARSVFVLHDVEGYGHAEIAEIAGMAIGTSKAHLHRARELLRKALLK
jgi:RNA polymerase sigma-70 factor (ECF subfamily)